MFESRESEKDETPAFSSGGLKNYGSVAVPSDDVKKTTVSPVASIVPRAVRALRGDCLEAVDLTRD